MIGKLNVSEEQENFSVETREKKDAAATKKLLPTTSKPISHIVEATAKYKSQ